MTIMLGPRTFTVRRALKTVRLVRKIAKTWALGVITDNFNFDATEPRLWKRRTRRTKFKRPFKVKWWRKILHPAFLELMQVIIKRTHKEKNQAEPAADAAELVRLLADLFRLLRYGGQKKEWPDPDPERTALKDWADLAEDVAELCGKRRAKEAKSEKPTPSMVLAGCSAAIRSKSGDIAAAISAAEMTLRQLMCTSARAIIRRMSQHDAEIGHVVDSALDLVDLAECIRRLEAGDHS